MSNLSYQCLAWNAPPPFHRTCNFPKPGFIQLSHPSHAATRSSPCVPTRRGTTKAATNDDSVDHLYTLNCDDRYNVASTSAGFSSGGKTVMRIDDANMDLTYGEFPLSSFDKVFDFAMKECGELLDRKTKGRRRRKLVDLGSGCGRLVLHASMRLAGGDPWDVAGIEISPELHDLAERALDRAYDDGLLDKSDAASIHYGDEEDGPDVRVEFHCGPASDFHNVLKGADVIFCYSTAWTAPEFDVGLCAPILPEEWSELLGRACQNGTVVITTDRTLNSRDGFVVLGAEGGTLSEGEGMNLRGRMDVENPSLFGSTCYVHVLRKP